MNDFAHYHQLVAGHLNKFSAGLSEPSELYAPIQYILELGGKRMRPVLSLMACEAYGGNAENSLDAAVAVEVFHNFSLIHDDIMDAAPLRRGKETVHKKWDLNTGILSGDAMLVKAYELLEGYDPEIYKPLMRIFSKAAREVCEGQQYDINFEERLDVNIEEYIQMITFKTAVLVAAALEMGALTGGADAGQAARLYEFGKELGIAFQLQDDLLDVYGDPEKFGKQVGGDILENKKTYLLIKALELAEGDTEKELAEWLASNPSEEKVTGVRAIYDRLGIPNLVNEAIDHYHKNALNALALSGISDEGMKSFSAFAEQLMQREF